MSNYIIHYAKGQESKNHKWIDKKWVNGAWQYIYDRVGGQHKKKSEEYGHYITEYSRMAKDDQIRTRQLNEAESEKLQNSHDFHEKYEEYQKANKELQKSNSKMYEIRENYKDLNKEWSKYPDKHLKLVDQYGRTQRIGTAGAIINSYKDDLIKENDNNMVLRRKAGQLKSEVDKFMEKSNMLDIKISNLSRTIGGNAASKVKYYTDAKNRQDELYNHSLASLMDKAESWLRKIGVL